MHIDEIRLKELCIKLKNNDMSYFDEFYNSLKELIFYNIYSIIKNHEISEDLLQETFVKFLNNLTNVNENNSIIGLLMTTSKNLSLDYLKKHNRIIYLEDSKIDNGSEEHLSIDKDFIINKIRNILKPKEVDIFMMHVLGELTFEEISKVTSRSLGTILWSYNNSIKKLKKELKI